MNVICVYSGRFHPPHLGHLSSFQQVAQVFGVDNCYFAISEKINTTNSPFSYEHRRYLAEFMGIDKTKIISLKNPYVFEYPGDRENTAIVFAVSKKDAMRFDFSSTKHNKDKVHQPYVSLDQCEPMGENLSRAYIYFTDILAFPLFGSKHTSGTDIRKIIVDNSNDLINISTQLYGKWNDDVLDILGRLNTMVTP
jgi:phosphopantetheine adenylyltransferase